MSRHRIQVELEKIIIIIIIIIVIIIIIIIIIIVTLQESLKKLELSTEVCTYILFGLQKLVVHEARALINQFKVLTSL